MIWYGGGLSNAIKQVKCSQSILLAFIYGDDRVSKRYRTYFLKEFPQEALPYIAIQIHQNSVAYEQFRKIYAKVPVPSVFLLGPDGRPMAIVCTEDPGRLTDAMMKAVEELSSLYGRPMEEILKVNDTSEDEEPSNKPILVTKARIQFRLPTDEVRAWDFPSKSTLQDVKLFLMETARIRPGFKLVRMYPRATFTPEDEAKTLEDLALTPSAALVVVPEAPVKPRIRKIGTGEKKAVCVEKIL